jgi:hypothetical protein
MNSAAYTADPEATRVVIVLEGPDGVTTCECIVRHYGPAVTDVRFPAGWRTIVADIGLDAFEVESEDQITAAAEAEFARITARESVRLAKAFVAEEKKEVA